MSPALLHLLKNLFSGALVPGAFSFDTACLFLRKPEMG